MEPPPAPIDSTATIGRRTGYPARRRCADVSATPSAMRHTSVVVPPMSNASARGSFERAREVRGRRDACRGPRGRHRERLRLRRVDRHHPARGVQQVEREAAAERLRELLDVARGERHHRRVQHGGGRPLVLAELGVDRAGDRDVGEAGAQHLRDGPLVQRVRIGVQQADGDALHALARERLHQWAELAEVDRREDRPVGPHALGHLEPEPARHERRGLGRHVDVVEMRPVHARDLEHVAEAAGRDQSHDRAPAFDDRVGDHGGAVGERAGRTGGRLERTEPVDHAGGRMRRRRGDLARVQPSRRLTRHDVGERAADVDADDGHGGCETHPPNPPRSAARHSRAAARLP